MTTAKKTIVGAIDPLVLAYTAGRDVELDRHLVEADCLGNAAHVTMLSRMPIKPALVSRAEASQVIAGLVDIMRKGREGRFEIRIDDQDVHLAVERTLTTQLGDIGKRIHTARSRNDQVAVDLRIYARDQLLGTAEDLALLASVLVAFGKRHAKLPMAGRTHMQPAMPASVGLWATCHAESLLDDAAMLLSAYELNDQSPLGAAAGFGVPLPIDRQLVADLLGFSRPTHNVAYAITLRGKLESILLATLAQIMLSLSRWAQDLMLYTMPEFGYFKLAADHGTGSSIMPQKNNPDALELMRAKAARVHAQSCAVYEVVRGLPSGYNRDVQETKEPLIEGFQTTRASLGVARLMMQDLAVNRDALLRGFQPGVFATDRALELVAGGMPFRDAYQHVKTHLGELESADAHAALAAKQHLGAPAGLDFTLYNDRVAALRRFVRDERKTLDRAFSRLLGVPYPRLA